MSHWLDKIVEIFKSDEYDINRLMNIVGGDPKTFFIGVDFDGVILSNQDVSNINLTKSNLKNCIINDFTIISSDQNLFVSKDTSLPTRFWSLKGEEKALWAISQKRQEERIAAIIRLVVVEEDVQAVAFFEKYEDKAKFANRILHDLNKNNITLSQRSRADSRILLEEFIRGILDKSFPMNRGKLLLYLSIYLGDIHQIAELVMARLKRNYTIGPFYDDIEEILSYWSINRVPLPSKELAALESISKGVNYPGGWV